MDNEKCNPRSLVELLARMERLGWLKSQADPKAGRRGRRDYRLTAEGHKALQLLRAQIRELYTEVVEAKS